jgi:hypothetical protein
VFILNYHLHSILETIIICYSIQTPIESGWVQISTTFETKISTVMTALITISHRPITLPILIWMSIKALSHYWFIVIGRVFLPNINKFLKAWERISMFTFIIIYSYISPDNNTVDMMEMKSFYCFQRKYWEPETGSIWSLFNYYTYNPNTYPIFWYFKPALYEHDCIAISGEKTKNNCSNMELNI